MKKEFFIGILFLIVLSIFLYVTSVVQNFNPFKQQDIYVVDFNRINGLKVEDQVLYSGNHIGYVKRIDFDEDFLNFVRYCPRLTKRKPSLPEKGALRIYCFNCACDEATLA